MTERDPPQAGQGSRRTGPRAPVWRPEDVADLLRLYRAGLSIAEVAQQLGRSVPACYGRMTILRRSGAAGMPPRRNSPVGEST